MLGPGAGLVGARGVQYVLLDAWWMHAVYSNGFFAVRQSERAADGAMRWFTLYRAPATVKLDGVRCLCYLTALAQRQAAGALTTCVAMEITRCLGRPAACLYRKWKLR